jgi:hypothetical protein
MMSADGMTNEGSIREDLEGSGRGLIEVLFEQHFPGGTEQTHENLSQGNQCPGRDSDLAPSE